VVDQHLSGSGSFWRIGDLSAVEIEDVKLCRPIKVSVPGLSVGYDQHNSRQLSPKANRRAESAPAKTEATSTQPGDAEVNARPANTAEKQGNPGSKPAGKCVLPLGELSRYENQAEQHRRNGDYVMAHQLFRQVLDCDRSDAIARKGLDRTIAAESQSPQ
jgi:TolA-binding protein